MWINKTKVGLIAAAVVAGAALSLSPAVAASQAPGAEAGVFSCSHSWSNKDATAQTINRTGVNMRSGPHAASGSACGVVASLNSGDKVYYHCYTETQSEGTWTHLRKAGTSLNGWVKDSLLPDGGSLYEC